MLRLHIIIGLMFLYSSAVIAQDAATVLRKAATKFVNTKALSVQMQMQLFDAFEGGNLLDEKKGYYKVKDSLYKYSLGEITIVNGRDVLLFVDNQSKSIDIQERSSLNLSKLLYVDTAGSAKIYNYKLVDAGKLYKVQVEGKHEGMSNSKIFIDKKNYSLKKVVVYTISNDEYFNEDNEPISYNLRMEIHFNEIDNNANISENEFSVKDFVTKVRKNEFIAVGAFKKYTLSNHFN